MINRYTVVDARLHIGSGGDSDAHSVSVIVRARVWHPKLGHQVCSATWAGDDDLSVEEWRSLPEAAQNAALAVKLQPVMVDHWCELQCQCGDMGRADEIVSLWGTVIA